MSPIKNIQLGHRKKSSSRAQRRANERQTIKNRSQSGAQNTTGNEVNERVQQLINPNAVIHICKIPVKENKASRTIKYGIDFLAFKEFVHREIESPSSSEDIQGYFSDTLHDFEVEESVDTARAAAGTISLLTTNPDAVRCTLDTYAQQQTFGIVFTYFVDMGQIQIACMPIEEWDRYVARFNTGRPGNSNN